MSKNITDSGYNKAKAISGPKPDWDKWDNSEEEKSKLYKKINTLIDGGVNLSQITILSPVTFEHSIASQVHGIDISQYVPDRKQGITFSTIHSFKGLENQFIILTDIESVSDRRMMYVAMSRARYGLYVLSGESAMNEYLAIYLRRLYQ